MMRRGRLQDSRFRIQCSIFAVLFLAAAPLFAQSPEKAGLGVVDFDVKGGLQEKDAGAIVAEIFIGRIDNRKYRLYERTQLNRLLKERALQATDLVADPEKAIQFGKAARIRYLLIGTVSRLGGNIILGARTIDCETGEIGERATLSASSMDQLPDMVDKCLAAMGLSRLTGRSVTPGYVGVRIEDLTDDAARREGCRSAAEMSEKLGLGGKTAGVYVVKVVPDGPAAKANVLPRDVIVEYLDKPVANAADFLALAAATEPGASATLKVIRNGKPLTLTLLITEQPYDLQLSQRAAVLWQKGDMEGAIALIREMVRLRPDEAEWQIYLGRALSTKKDWDGALAAFREAIRLDPDSEQAHFQLGYALGEKGEVDAAISEYNDLLRRAPDHGFAHSNLGSLFWRKDDMDGAVREYSEAVRLMPDNAGAYYNLALACARKRDARRAVDALRRAIELDPKYRTGLETNKAFEAIHGDKEFKRLIGK